MSEHGGDWGAAFRGTAAAPQPPAMQAYKRGVLKPAPKEFTVTPLPPAKHGRQYSYGIRITPLRLDTRSSVSTKSSARSWNTDYEIWRRWDDCLWFQELLEQEYAQMSREKRKRLKQGKGIKKDGVYKTSDFAASFDSLPPGPDYHDIATDVHQYLPKISKKGTIFNPSVALVQQRGKEFEAMINALWQEDSPTLVRELREVSQIRDFFGFWQRDEDRLRKSGIFVTHGNLYGTTAPGASKSAVSLVPTLASARNSISSAMFFRARVPEEPIGHLPVIADDESSYMGSLNSPSSPTTSSTRTPPSPKSPRSPRSAMMSRRPKTSAGEMSVHSVETQSSFSTIQSQQYRQPVSPQAQQHQQRPLTQQSMDGDPMRFVLEPDMMEEEQMPIVRPTVILSDPPRRASPAIPDTKHRPTPLDLGRPRSPSRNPSAHRIQVPGASSYEHGLPSPPLSPPRSSNRTPRPGTSPSSQSTNFRSFASEDDQTTPPASSNTGIRSPGFTVASEYHIPMPRFPPRSTTVHRQDSAPAAITTPTIRSGNAAPIINVHRNTPSPTGSSSPPRSATRSLESATSDNAPSMFSEDDGASSKRTSWESGGSRSSGDRSSGERSQKAQRSPPISFDRFVPSHRLGSSISSADTVSGRLQARASASTPPAVVADPRNSTMSETNSLLDSYFNNLTIARSDSPSLETISRPTSFVSVTDTVTSRESISFGLPTPDRFPAPFQHRPPGQFHLPWSPTQTRTPSLASLTPPTLSPSTSMLSLEAPTISPSMSVLSLESTTLPGAPVTIKAMHGESIVCFRADKSLLLAELRHKISEKLRQENVHLNGGFVLGYKNPRSPGRLGGRARAYSTTSIATISTIASIGSIDPGSLSFLNTELDWRNLTECCGSKLTLVVLDSAP